MWTEVNNIEKEYIIPIFVPHWGCKNVVLFVTKEPLAERKASNSRRC